MSHSAHLLIPGDWDVTPHAVECTMAADDVLSATCHFDLPDVVPFGSHVVVTFAFDDEVVTLLARRDRMAREAPGTMRLSIVGGRSDDRLRVAERLG